MSLGFSGLLLGTALLSVISAVAGTGGGSLYIPLFSLSFNDVHTAIPLSKTAVLGTSIGACVVNMLSKNGPNGINYRIVTLIQPCTMLGCIIGIILNILFPSSIIIICLVGILGFTAAKTYKSAEKLREQFVERSEERKLPLIEMSRKMEDFESCGSTPGSAGTYVSYIRSAEKSSGEYTLDSDVAAQREAKQRRKECRENLIECFLMVCVWMVSSSLIILGGSPAALICGTPNQQRCLWACVCFLFSFVAWTYWRLSSHEDAGREGTSLEWLSSPKICALYTSLSLSAGVAAALLGIGGGLIKSPMLIAMGMAPIDAVATSNFMIFFTSSTNVIGYAMAGRLQVAQGIWFTVVACLGGIVGVSFLRKLFHSERSQAYLTFLLFGVIVVGGLAMLAVDVRNLLHPTKEVMFEDVCHRLSEDGSYIDWILHKYLD